MRTSWLVPLVILAACDAGPNHPDTQQTGRDEFSVRYGREVAVPGTVATLGFDQVTHESRCPADVVCIWEGQVTLLLGVTIGDGPTTPLEVTLRGGVSEPVTIQGVTLRLFRVDPYPISSAPHDLDDYVAFFRVGAPESPSD